MSFVLFYLHINNLSNDIVFTIKQLVDDTLLSFVADNAKAYGLNSKMKSKSE